MLKESGRERINAVYGTKEQCRKEFQDEIARLRQQFQLVGRKMNFSFTHGSSRRKMENLHEFKNVYEN